MSVWALLLRDPDVEKSLLSHVAERLRSRPRGWVPGVVALSLSPQGAPLNSQRPAGFPLLLQVATRILSGKYIFALGRCPAFLAERMGFGMSEAEGGSVWGCVFICERSLLWLPETASFS